MLVNDKANYHLKKEHSSVMFQQRSPSLPAAADLDRPLLTVGSNDLKNILEPEKLLFTDSGQSIEKNKKSQKKKKANPKLGLNSNSVAATVIQPNGFSLALVNQTDKEELIKVMAADGSQNLVKIKKSNKHRWEVIENGVLENSPKSRKKSSVDKAPQNGVMTAVMMAEPLLQ